MKAIVNSVASGLVILAVWTIGYVAAARLLFRTLASANGYALLTAWWIVAYTASKTAPRPLSGLVAGGLFALLFVLSAVFERDWLYHDMVGVGFWWALAIGALQGLVVASPILFDAGVEVLRRRRA
jgi:hypothetical protein